MVSHGSGFRSFKSMLPALLRWERCPGCLQLLNLRKHTLCIAVLACVGKALRRLRANQA